MGIRTSGHSRGQGRLCTAVLGCLLVLAACSSGAGTGTPAPPPARAHLSVTKPSTPAAPAGTSVHAADPYAGDGTLSVAVARSVQGSCWSTSIAAPAARSYRCFSGNSILDPCFAAPASAASTGQPRTLACRASPWSRATSLRLTKPLPKPDPVGTGRIWALTLSNGARCVAATGTVAFVAGHNLSDTCPRGYAAQVADPRARSMTASYGRPGDTRLQRLAVTAVWRG